jgi:hypothetical protein
MDAAAGPRVAGSRNARLFGRSHEFQQFDELAEPGGRQVAQTGAMHGRNGGIERIGEGEAAAGE